MLDRRLLAILALALLLRAGFAVFFPSPAFGDDAWHYLVSRNIALGQGVSSPYVENYWGHVEVPQKTSYRPPLFNLIAGAGMWGASLGASALGLGSGNLFWVLQILNVIFGALAVYLVYLIARKIFDVHAAEISAAISAISPVLVSLSVGGEVRMFFAVLFLASLYFWLSGKRGIAGVFCGLSVLTHQMGLGLAIGYGIMLAFEMLGKRSGFLPGLQREWKTTALFFFPSIIAVLLLLLFNFAQFGDAFYSTSKYVPLVTDWGQMGKLEPPRFEGMDWKAAGLNTAQNLVRTFVPIPFLRGEDGGVELNLDFAKNPNMNYNSISSISTIVLLLLAGILVFEKWKKGKIDGGVKVFLATLLGGLILGVLTAHFPSGYAYSFVFGSAFFVIMFGAGRLMQEKGIIRNALLLLTGILLLSQFVIFLDRGVEKTGVHDWILGNVGGEARIMSSDCLELLFYADRTCFAMPNEEAWEIREVAVKYEIKYLVQKIGEERIYSGEPLYSDAKWLVYKAA